MRRTTVLHPDLPEVCRLGLATRGSSRLREQDVRSAVERGVNYLNWCGHPDGLSRAIAALGAERERVVIAAQFQARTAREAEAEFESMCRELRTDRIDVLTLYYVESDEEWREITAEDGAWRYLNECKRQGRLKSIGLTSHQRPLAANWARSGLLDLLMIRYNAAHRGALEEVFPLTSSLGIPVVAFTGLRWKALLDATPEDPPGFRPPTAAACYRLCLAEEAISVVLTAPATREELDQNLILLDDWRAPDAGEREDLMRHGERVRRTAGVFW